MKFLKMFLAALLAVIVGGVLSTILWIMILVGVMASSMDSSVYVKPHSILVINFNEDITDTPLNDPFAQFDIMSMNINENLSLYQALCAIDAAKRDDRIDGIYIRMTGGGLVNAATIEELRAAVADFKAESGKFVLAYNETYTQAGYYFASVADKVYIQPEGGMEWSGMSFNVTFFKGLLDKLDIEVEVFRPTACKYKSAVEPYILTKMSEANRQQMQELADSMWETIAGEVSQSRGISVETLNALADNLAVTLPEEAVANGLVDGAVYEDQMDDILAEHGAETGKDGKYNYISLSKYASQVSPAGNLKADKIALVYAEGEIVDGFGGSGKIYGNTLAAKIKSVREDEDIKAVVLRVNSPGGSALASDIVWRELELLKAEKPVIVSMGNYAASGGYYISAPADVIVADKLTLTGSIGVFGIMPYAGKFLNNKLGVTFDTVTTNKNSNVGGLTEPLTPAARATLMRGVDKVYTTFTTLVSEGRNLPIERVLDIAGGRVWSGNEGLEIGLVDGIGGLQTALALAADKAGIADNYRIEEVVDQPDYFSQLFSTLNARIATRYMQSRLGIFYGEYEKLKEVIDRQGIQTYCPYTFNF